MKIEAKGTPAERPPPILVTVTVNKIEEVMNQTEKEKTALTKLTPEELANLNDFLDTAWAVTPGSIDPS